MQEFEEDHRCVCNQVRINSGVPAAQNNRRDGRRKSRLKEIRRAGALKGANAATRIVKRSFLILQIAASVRQRVKNLEYQPHRGQSKQ